MPTPATACRWRSTTSPAVRRIRSSCSPTPPASTAMRCSRSPRRWRPRFHSWGMDFRGHGDTALPDGWTVSWDGYGDDAFAAASALAALPGGHGGVVAFGHSMGGAALGDGRCSSTRAVPAARAVRADRLPHRSAARPGRPEPAARRRAPTAVDVRVVRGGDRQLRLEAADVGVRPRRPRCVRAPRLPPGRRPRAAEVRSRTPRPTRSTTAASTRRGTRWTACRRRSW